MSQRAAANLIIEPIRGSITWPSCQDNCSPGKTLLSKYFLLPVCFIVSWTLVTCSAKLRTVQLYHWTHTVTVGDMIVSILIISSANCKRLQTKMTCDNKWMNFLLYYCLLFDLIKQDMFFIFICFAIFISSPANEINIKKFFFFIYI